MNNPNTQTFEFHLGCLCDEALRTKAARLTYNFAGCSFMTLATVGDFFIPCYLIDQSVLRNAVGTVAVHTAVAELMRTPWYAEVIYKKPQFD